MKLFQILPANLFSILASKNREIYVEALFVLRRAFKQEMSINKADLVAMLIANLEEMMLKLDLAEENDAEADAEVEVEVEEMAVGIKKGIDEKAFAEEEQGGSTLSAMAYFILRRLRETGWIEMEYQVESFEENVTLPDYAVKLLNLLYSLTDESVREYNSYVYSTYSALKTADQERDNFMYNALLTAYENTINLVDELKTLHNNIRRYHQALNEYASVNEVLKGHFDEYKNLIMDRVYHPLKTLDSVPRFKEPIKKILQNWLWDQSLREQIGEQAILRGKYKTKEEAAEDLILKIGEIGDIYEKLEEILAEIDRKNAAYTRASIEKMRYLLNTDRSIKGKIVELLRQVVADEAKASGGVKKSSIEGKTRPDLIERMAAQVNIFQQGYLDEKSLYVRAVRSSKEEGEPLAVRVVDEVAGEQGLTEFVDRARRTYSQAKVLKFMEEVMQGVDVVMSEEIFLPDEQAFILLVLASLKGEERRTFYRVEFMEGYVENNGFRIPRMRFSRKEHRRENEKENRKEKSHVE